MKLSKEEDIWMREHAQRVGLKMLIDGTLSLNYEILFLTYKKEGSIYHFRIYFRKPEKIGWEKMKFDLNSHKYASDMVEYIMNRGLCLCCSSYNHDEFDHEFIAFNANLIEEITKPYYVKFQTGTQDEWYIPLDLFNKERKYNLCETSGKQLTFLQR